MVEEFKAKLQRGECVTVINPDHPHPNLVEFLGGLSIDAVFIDCEQGSANTETVKNMARAARLANIVSVVRLFSSEEGIIERYLLGCNVDGIVVPRLDNSEQAAQVVAAVRYCYPKEYHRTLIVVQIETCAAMETLDDFLRVDGIDAYFIGPVDLAKSLGYSGDFRRPEVQEVIDNMIATIRRAGKVAGILVDRDNVGGYVENGVQFLYEHANSFLTYGAKDFIHRVRGS